MSYKVERIQNQSAGEWANEYDDGMKNHNQGVANAYVLAGSTKKDRVKRLAELPEDMRTKAEQHVRAVFAVRNHYKNNRI